MRIERGTGSLIRLAGMLAVACASTPEVTTPPPAPRPPLPALEIAPIATSQPDASPRSAAVRLLDESYFTLNLQDVDLSSVLVGLGHESPLNVVVDPGIKGTVTANLKDVTLLEILDQIVLPRGYHYEVERNLLRIFPSDRQTRTYRVDYPNYTRKGASDLTISGAISSKPELGEASSGGGGGADVSSSGVQTLQAVDFWSELERALNAIVGGSEAGPESEGADEEAEATDGGGPPASRLRVLVSPQSSLVTVTAESRILTEVEHYLDELARVTGLQVLIDAQIIEVTLGDEFDFGLDMEGAPKLSGSTMGTFARLITPGLREATFVQSLAASLTEGGGGFSFGLANDDFGVILRALARQSDVRVVSTPRIATLNNHKALIKVVRNEVFFIAETEVTIIQNVGQEPVTEFTPQIVPVGVTLDVTPYVADNREITLHVHPSVSEVVGTVEQPKASSSQPQVGSLPVIDLREADAVLRVEDGQTIVIGGLIQSNEIAVERKVPLLGDIPWLGRLFRNSSIDERRSELLILLTPTILDAPHVARVTRDANESLEKIEARRRDRSHEPPWWRKPQVESHGVR